MPVPWERTTFVQARAEVIATEVLLFEIELREGMGAVHNGLNPLARAMAHTAFTGVICP